jgi:hypothetical protein
MRDRPPKRLPFSSTANNSLFDWEIYQGGSDDPNANRSLADVIKAAKGNNVPVDVSTAFLHYGIEAICIQPTSNQPNKTPNVSIPYNAEY